MFIKFIWNFFGQEIVYSSYEAIIFNLSATAWTMLIITQKPNRVLVTDTLQEMAACRRVLSVVQSQR